MSNPRLLQGVGDLGFVYFFRSQSGDGNAVSLQFIWGRETALPIGVNLSLKALVSLAFSRVYNPLNPPW